MKGLLQVRLAEIEKSIAKQNHIIQQHVADLNLMHGARNELLFLLNDKTHQKDSLNLDDVKEMLGADSIEVIEK